MKTRVPKVDIKEEIKSKDEKKEKKEMVSDNKKHVLDKQHIDPALVNKAVTALLKHHTANLDVSKSLLGTDVPLQVQFGLEVAPGRSQHKPIRLQIPHPIHKLNDANDDGDDDEGLEEPEVCLIVKEDSKPAVQDMIAKFPEHMGCIKKVLGLQSLRNKHAEYKQRRDLLARFTVFMADDRILPMLTSALGKDFLAAKKHPIPVRISRKEALPFAIRNALTATYMHIPEGTCLTIRAGHTSMSVNSLVQNVVAISETAASKIPRKWANVRSISVKLPTTASLPIYNKTPAELLEIATITGLSSAWKTADEEAAEKQKELLAATAKDDRKRKMAADKSPLLRALKKQKKDQESSEEKDRSPIGKKSEKDTKPEASSRNKRKQSVDGDVNNKSTKGAEEQESSAKNVKTGEKKLMKDDNNVETTQKNDDNAPAVKKQKKGDKSTSETPKQGVKHSTEKKQTKDDKHSTGKKQAKDDQHSAEKERTKDDKHSKEKKQMKDDKHSAGKEKAKDDKHSAGKEQTKDDKHSLKKKQTKGDKQSAEKKDKTDDKHSSEKKQKKVDKRAETTQTKHENRADAKMSPKDGKSSAALEKGNEGSSFLAAKKFTGSKKGYVFKKGDKGVGYYVDVEPVVDKMAMEAIAKMQSRPSKQGGSRKSAGGGGKRRRGR